MGKCLFTGYPVANRMIGIIFALFYITDYINDKDVIAGHGEMTKQEHISKKIWKKPKLRVLCRGTSEENVLSICKNDQPHSSGPGWNKCRHAGTPSCDFPTAS